MDLVVEYLADPADAGALVLPWPPDPDESLSFCLPVLLRTGGRPTLYPRKASCGSSGWNGKCHWALDPGFCSGNEAGAWVPSSFSVFALVDFKDSVVDQLTRLHPVTDAADCRCFADEGFIVPSRTCLDFNGYWRKRDRWFSTLPRSRKQTRFRRRQSVQPQRQQPCPFRPTQSWHPPRTSRKVGLLREPRSMQALYPGKPWRSSESRLQNLWDKGTCPLRRPIRWHVHVRGCGCRSCQPRRSRIFYARHCQAFMLQVAQQAFRRMCPSEPVPKRTLHNSKPPSRICS